MRIKLFLAALVAGFAIVAGAAEPVEDAVQAEVVQVESAAAHTGYCGIGTYYFTLNGVLHKEVFVSQTGQGYATYRTYRTYKRIDVYYYYIHTHVNRHCPLYV